MFSKTSLFIVHLSEHSKLANITGLQKKLGYIFPAKTFSIFKIVVFDIFDKMFLQKNLLNAMENLQKKN